MTDKKLFNELVDKASNRRSFVRKLGIASAVVGATAATATRGLAQSMIQDSDVLNFALNLEYLEAEFYTVATTGMTLSQFGGTVSGSGLSGPTAGGAQVNFGTNTALMNVALELAQDEREHVTLIQSLLAGMGVASIAKPSINLNAAGFGFGSVNDFLKLARMFEDLGVTAYAGAAGLIQSKTVLGYAARILAVEALHSGNIRLMVAQNAVATTAIDGADHLPPPTGNQYFTTDSQGLVETRTPQQVLYIAFGNAANSNAGFFFPSGVNGIVNTSAAAGAMTDGAYITVTPSPVVSTSLIGTATIAWSAPNSSIIEVHVNAPNGPLLTHNINMGSMTTGNWVKNGMVFYLQDVSNGQPLTANYTLATATAVVVV